VKPLSRLRRGLFLMAFVLLGGLSDALACATCYGQSDSPLAQGMNWGIFALLVVVAMVLASVTAFFVFVARRSASFRAVTPSSKPCSQTWSSP
jgi:hypothetical protein